MIKFIASLSITILTLNSLFGQDFEFVWKIDPSFCKSYSIKIDKKNTDCYIHIYKDRSTDIILKRIKEKDCDLLLHFLSSYDFPIGRMSTKNSIKRNYIDTKILPDSNWLLVKGDSIRRELLWIKHYYFDKDSSKCYGESYLLSTWVDGDTYKGEFTINGETKTFFCYSHDISEKDFELNKMIFRLIRKYDKQNDYKRLGETIMIDRPRKKI
jgi:hypothetical protein